VIRHPLRLTETEDKFDIFMRVSGGGVNGQVEAVRLGIARALIEFNRELKPTLKNAGLLTRDSRIKERKKYGLLGARKAPQYHKR
jgi:small subunit ribosomal protein S9